MEKMQKSGIDFFERYLTIWVALCMVVGVLIVRIGGWMTLLARMIRYSLKQFLRFKTEF